MVIMIDQPRRDLLYGILYRQKNMKKTFIEINGNLESAMDEFQNEGHTITDVHLHKRLKNTPDPRDSLYIIIVEYTDDMTSNNK